MSNLMLPDEGQDLKNRIIDMLVREEEMMSVLRDKSTHNFPRALSLKLLRTLISPKFDNVSAARALSVFIFKNKKEILQKYSLLKVIEDVAPLEANNNTYSQKKFPQECEVEDWLTSNSDSCDSKESIHVTETKIKISNADDSNTNFPNLDTIEETCIKTKQKFFSSSKLFNQKSPVFSFLGDNDTDSEEVWCNTKNTIEGENSSSGSSTPCRNSRKRKRNLYEFFDVDDNPFEDVKEKKIKTGFLHKKMKLESEILKIQKEIEMEKLKQQQFITQIRLMELGIKKKEYHSMKPEESSID